MPRRAHRNDRQAIAQRQANVQLRASVQAFLERNCSRADSQAMGFDALVLFLRVQELIRVTGDCVINIHTRCVNVCDINDVINQPERINIRMFLAAYMITVFPNQTFEDINQHEAALITAATAILDSFDTLCQRIIDGTGVQYPTARVFLESLVMYIRQFNAWKAPDEIKLAQRFEYAIIALYESKSTAYEGSESALEIERNLERLCQKYINVAGTAKFEEFKIRNAEYMQTPYSTDPIDEFPSLKMSNEQIGQELIMNPAFRFSMETNIAMHKAHPFFSAAFWNSLRDDMRLATPVYTRAIKTIREARSGILDVCNGNAAQTAQVTDVLDMDFLTTQISNGLFDWNRCKTLATNLVQIINTIGCTAQTIAETNAAWNTVLQEIVDNSFDTPQAISNTLRFIINRVNVLRMIAANKKLDEVTLTMATHGMDYMREKFKAKLDAGTLTLDKTTSWLRSVVEDPETNIAFVRTGAPEAYFNLFHRALMKLVIAGPRLATLPETMQLDVHRLDRLHKEFRFLVQAATAISTLSPLSQSASTLAVRNGIINTLAMTETALKTDEILDIIVEKIGTTIPPPAKATLISQVQHSMTSGNPVAAIIQKRLAKFWVSILDDPAAEPANLDAVCGFKDRVISSAHPLRNLAAKNIEIYAAYYNSIVMAAALPAV